MSLLVLVMAVAVVVVGHQQLTTSALLFGGALLVASLVVDVLVLFGPGGDSAREPLSRHYRSRWRAGRR
jgi:hypothetical protein